MTCETVRRAPLAPALLWSVLAVVGLAACTPPPPPIAPGIRIEAATRKAVEAHVEGRIIHIASAAQQCIFPDSVGVTNSVAHAVVGECIWHQPRSGEPVPTGVSGRGGVFSVSVLPEDAPDDDWADFAAFIRSPQGARALDVGAVSDVIANDQGVLVITHDDDDQVICRAYTDLNGRLAVVALLDPPEGEGLREMRARLDAFMTGLRAANSAAS